ncbi:MAG: hypothetical protein K2X39_05625, partial [Silvanigrellaceae bacterium]|nr:hypothetical protein [Silvanigrellaceae bacterium]
EQKKHINNKASPVIYKTISHLHSKQYILQSLNEISIAKSQPAKLTLLSESKFSIVKLFVEKNLAHFNWLGEFFIDKEFTFAPKQLAFTYLNDTYNITFLDFE